MKKQYLIVLIAILGLVSCKNNSSETKTETTAPQEAAQNQGQRLAVDTTTSKINWKGFKPGGSHHGTLGIKSGELFVDNNTLKSGTFVLDMNRIIDEDLTVDQGSDKLVGHLKSADFFDVEKYPEGKFTITQVEELPAGGEYTHRIHGNLELKGTSQNINFEAKATKEGNVYTATTQTITIDRTKWGVNYGSKNIFKDLKDKFINDEIEVSITIKATAQ